MNQMFFQRDNSKIIKSLLLAVVLCCSLLLTACSNGINASLLPAFGAGREGPSNAPAETEPPREQKPPKGITICVDPGHGFDDGGTSSDLLGNVFEKDTTLAVSLKLRDFLKNASLEDDVIDKMVELADIMNALPELVEVVPEAVVYSFSTYLKNWDYMIQDIYDLNPDVTLLVIGMYDTSARLEEDLAESKTAYIKHGISKAIISAANKPMIEGAEKFGYIYVDTNGALFETNHPTVEGHRYIADRILEALPDARFDFDDVPMRATYYKAAEYMCINGIMKGITETTFGPDEPLTKDVLTSALSKINGKDETSESTDAVSKFDFALSLLKSADKTDVIRFLRLLVFCVEIVFSGNGNITRAEAAQLLYEYAKGLA